MCCSPAECDVCCPLCGSRHAESAPWQRVRRPWRRRAELQHWSSVWKRNVFKSLHRNGYLTLMCYVILFDAHPHRCKTCPMNRTLTQHSRHTGKYIWLYFETLSTCFNCCREGVDVALHLINYFTLKAHWFDGASQSWWGLTGHWKKAFFWGKNPIFRKSFTLTSSSSFMIFFILAKGSSCVLKSSWKQTQIFCISTVVASKCQLWVKLHKKGKQQTDEPAAPYSRIVLTTRIVPAVIQWQPPKPTIGSFPQTGENNGCLLSWAK